MPIVDGNYVSPEWKNNARPAITAAEMQALTDTVQETQSEVRMLEGQKVGKQEVGNAGIESESFAEIFGGEFTITTVQDEDHLSPHATASFTGEFQKEYTYRVTFGDSQYILPFGLDIENDWANVRYHGYIGDIGLMVSDTSPYPFVISDVPFLIISNLDTKKSIDVFTVEAGTYSIKVEKIEKIGTQFPKFLMYGTEYSPFYFKTNENSMRCGISIGNNLIPNDKGTVAIGSGNMASGNNAIATGFGTAASGDYSMSQGTKTVASGYSAHAEGFRTIASGEYSHAGGCRSSDGTDTEARGNQSFAHGIGCHAYGNSSVAMGQRCETNGVISVAFNNYTVANGRGSAAFGNYTNSDNDCQFSIGYGNKQIEDSIFEVGNGTLDDGTPATRGQAATIRQNAFTVLRDGTVIAQKTVQIGGTKITEAQLQALLNLIS